MYKMALCDVVIKTRVQLFTKKMPKTQYRIEHLFGLSCARCTKCARKIKEKYTIYTKAL